MHSIALIDNNFAPSGKLRNKFFCLIIILLIFNPLSSAQSCTDTIDTNHVFQKRKKKFIKNKYLLNINSFEELSPTCVDNNDTSSYCYQYETYYLKDDINKVWNSYKNISLPEIYSGHIVSFGFMYSKKKKKIFYIDSDSYEGMGEGQVFFINLDLLGGLKKLVVAYEVTKVDDDNKTIQFCYINNGISEGTQRIILSKTEDGLTKVQHNTIYRSQSKIRDKFLYPGFHKKIVKELHKNFRIALQ